MEVKPQPVLSIDCQEDRIRIIKALHGIDNPMFYFYRGVPEPDFPKWMGRFCPFGRVGDVIYVKEKWRKYAYLDDQKEITEFAADNPGPLYLSDGDGCQIFNKDGTERMVPWRPSATMPREAARIFLRIENIRVMKVQELDDEDFDKQGIEEMSHRCGGFGYYEAGGDIYDCSCQSFKYSPMVMGFIGAHPKNRPIWEANKYCWILDFTKTDKP